MRSGLGSFLLLAGLAVLSAGAEEKAADPGRAARQKMVQEHFLKHFQIGVEGPIEWHVQVREKHGARFVTQMQYLSGCAKPGEKGDDNWFFKYGALEDTLKKFNSAKVGCWFTWYVLAASAPAFYKPGPAQATPVNAKNVETMRSYWEIYRRVLKACGKYPENLIVMQIEPDEWGHLLLSAGMDPEKVDVKVGSTGLDEIKDLPDNQIGWAKAFKVFRDLYAPHVLLCCNPSFWDAKGSMTAKKWAGYFKKMGVDEWELAVGQTHDWDHGLKSNGANAKWPPYAEKDIVTYFPTWEGLHAWIREWNEAIGLPLVMWQMPAGNAHFRTCDGSPGHGCDGLAEALLEDYPKNDLVARFVKAGCVGWIFSRGGDGALAYDGRKDGITNPEPLSGNKGNTSEYPDDDGGYIRLRGSAYYKNPCPITGRFRVAGLVMEGGGPAPPPVASSAPAGNGSTTSGVAAPPPPKPHPALKPARPEVLKEWEGRLKTRLQALLAAGRKPRIEFRALKSRITLNALDAKDNLKVSLEDGGQMNMTWSQFEPKDILDLALAVAAGDEGPEDHALAAFFLLNANEPERAEDQLAKAGDFGPAVRAAFANGGANGKSGK
jgi:hypothetical protein